MDDDGRSGNDDRADQHGQFESVAVGVAGGDACRSRRPGTFAMTLTRPTCGSATRSHPSSRPNRTPRRSDQGTNTIRSLVPADLVHICSTSASGTALARTSNAPWATASASFGSSLTKSRPDTEPMPEVSTLNAYDGFITSNMAIVPTLDGSIDAYAAGLTELILDISGYFAP